MLEAEQIKKNWEEYRQRVNDYFPTRKDKLNVMYDELEKRMALMPASPIAHYHNAFAGGYIDHVLRVMDCTVEVYKTWKKMGADVSGYTQEELLFAAMHHDLGKAGFPGEGNEVYQVETSDWHRKNQGKMYKMNGDIPFSLVPDLSVFLLQQYDVKYSWNEYLAIKIHDGMYSDANKPYFVSRTADAKLKNNMPLILHHADHMASQIEYEKWVAFKNNEIKAPKKPTKYSKTNSLKSKAEADPQFATAFKNIIDTTNDEEDQ